MKAHLLYRDKDFDFTEDLFPTHEDLVQDLELVTLLQAMAQGDKYLFEVSKRVVLTSLRDPEAIVYRQQVLADCIADPDMLKEMYAISLDPLEIKRSGGFWGHTSRYPPAVLSGAVRELEMYVGLLKRLRRIADDHVDTVRSEGLQTLFRSLQIDLDDDYFATIEHQLKRLRFRGGELMSAELDRDNSGINFVLRSPEEAKVHWRERIGIAPRTLYSFTIPPRDEAGSNALSDLTNRGVNLVANAAAQSADHIESYFAMLRAELGFYVSCLNVRDVLEAKGEPTCFPEPVPWEPPELTVRDLRDVCLALRTTERVIGNDVDARGKTLVIVTGANSGGKSTFLRSVGLAQLLLQCGMFVTAQSYRANVSEGLFTHFIREEDASMNSGRLDEELSRMSEITDQIKPHCLMLFNESFAATNEREGSEIARQVVRALLDADIRVFFVTHQFDFAEGFHKEHGPRTLFLRAERDAGGKRSFKLVEKEPLPTSYGEDLYRKIFADATEQPRALPPKALGVEPALPAP